MATPRYGSSRRFLASGSSSSMRPPTKEGCCAEEKDYWQVLVKLCGLSRQDVSTIYSLDFVSVTKLSMLGIKPDAQCLVKAGITEGKAQMIHMFTTYLLHCKYHRIPISKDISFDQVLEFNFLMANPQEFAPASDTHSEITEPSQALVLVATSTPDVSVPTAPSPTTTKTDSTKKKKESLETREQDPRKTRRRLRNRVISNDTTESSSITSRSSLKSNRTMGSKKSVSWNQKLDSIYTFTRDASVSGNSRTATTVASTNAGSASRWESSSKMIPSSISCPSLVKRRVSTEICSSSNVSSSIACRWSSSNLPDASAQSVGCDMKKSNSADYTVSLPRRRSSIGDSSYGDDIHAHRNTFWTRKPSSDTNGSNKNAQWVSTKANKGSDQRRSWGTMLLSTPVPTLSAPVSMTTPLEKKSRTPSAPPMPTHVEEGTPEDHSIPEAKEKINPFDLLVQLGETEVPLDAAERRSLRWAQALNVDEDLTDSDWTDSEDEGDEYDSDDEESEDEESDEESETDSETNSDEELEEVTGEEPVTRRQRSRRKKEDSASTSSQGTSLTPSFTFKTCNVAIDEWTMPANQVIPINLQTLLRAATDDPELDIQQQIHLALARQRSCPTLPAE